MRATAQARNLALPEKQRPSLNSYSQLLRTAGRFDIPAGGSVRPLPDLRAAVAEATTWRLSAQYLQIARTVPALLAELARVAQTPQGAGTELAALLVTAYRCADSVAYEYGVRDLSARLIELMRWAAPGGAAGVWN